MVGIDTKGEKNGFRKINKTRQDRNRRQGRLESYTSPSSNYNNRRWYRTIQIFSSSCSLANDDVSGESDEIKKLAEIYFTDDAKAKHKEAMESGGPG